MHIFNTKNQKQISTRALW